MTRVAYLGPEGTFSHEALAGAGDFEGVATATIYEAVMAVQNGAVERALVPIENALEGSVNVTLDTLAGDAPDVAITGELVHPVRYCLLARDQIALERVSEVLSHPQGLAQCAAFLRTRLERARTVAVSSTAEAVRLVVGGDGERAALANHLAGRLYGGHVLGDGVEDVAGNETRFVWLARADRSPDAAAGDEGAAGADGPRKTSIVFWGVGAQAPGWLVRCLSELGFRGVNMTRIESRPRRQGLGRYMFFVDLEGDVEDRAVAEALEGLARHTDRLRVLGSYPAA